VNNSSPGPGGGVRANVSGGDVVLRYCTVANNVSGWNSGGGIYATTTSPNQILLEGCMIAGNSVNPSFTGLIDSKGGGVYASGNLVLRHCLVSGNLCVPGVSPGAPEGGGIYKSEGTFVATNCAFSWNRVDNGSSSGGGVYLHFTTSARIANCSFAHNTDFGVKAYGATVSVENSIFWGNGMSPQISGANNVTCCDVQGGNAGQGNTDLNPLFANQTDLTLAPNSPCIDAGNPDPTNNDTCFPPSQGGVRNDMGAYGGPGACGWLSGKAPTITLQPQPQTSCLGQSATFRVNAAGDQPFVYQWCFGGAPLSGETSTNLVRTGLQGSEAGAYSVIVSNTFGSVTSAPVQLVVNDACVDLRMYAGLNMSGLPGADYVLSCTTNLGTPTIWAPLATNTMATNGWFYLDMASPFSPQRFYKVTLKP
jgi:hypothetical protein